MNQNFKLGLLLCLTTLLSSCSGFKSKDFKQAPTENRLIMQNQQVIDIRPSKESQDFQTTLPKFKNIASVKAPSSPSSTKDVQATAVALEGNFAYISYNMIGEEVFGAIDIIDISTPNEPVIAYSFSTDEYEFSDLRVKNNILYLSGHQKETTSRKPGAIVMIVDVNDKSNPTIKDVKQVPGIYATSLDLSESLLLVNTGSIGGNYKYDVSNPLLLNLISSEVKENGLYALSSQSYDLSLSGARDTTFTAKSNLNSLTKSFTINSEKSLAPSRFIRKNALIYLNNTKSKSFHVLDLSKLSEGGEIEELSKIALPGTANGLTRGDQFIYLAQGEKGFFVVDALLPDEPKVLGSFEFKEDNGSANNIWLEMKDELNYLFLADGRQGLRILTESRKAVEESKEISFFARGSDTSSSKVLIRVNGEDFSTLTLDSIYKLYTLQYTRNLTSDDKVDIILLGDKSSAFISYLKARDKFCYQSPNAPEDDYGLMKMNQGFSLSQTCSNVSVTQVCVPGEIKPGGNNSCALPGNVAGKMTCSDSGLSYQCQTTNSCNSGFVMIGGVCEPKVCEPGSSRDCSDSISNRTETCNALGNAYNQCVFNSCKSTHVLVGEECQLKVCEPGTSSSCSVSNGTGEKSCNDKGDAFGSCETKTCSTGFYLSNNSCVPQVCSPNSSASCSILSLQGTKTCNSQGSSFGSCNVTGSQTCDAGHYYSFGVCLPQTCQPNETLSCSIANGSGIKTCSSNGSEFGSCQTISCSQGFYKEGNACLPQSCSPGSSNQCVVNHEVGVQVCNLFGSGKTPCISTGICESGFYKENGTCVPQICSPASVKECSAANGSGTSICNLEGSGYASCLITSCDEGFYFDNGSCKAQACSPSSSKECSINHLIGEQTCNPNGSGFGLCVPGESCEAGYYKVGLLCLPQTCSPGTEVSCNEGNGSGKKVCNSSGSSYGFCQISSCDAGFNRIVSKEESKWTFCSNEDQYCSFVGQANVRYGKNNTFINKSITNGTSCSNGVFTDPLFNVIKECQVEGSFKCEPQACSPNVSETCSVPNGSGTKTCNSTGTSFSQCRLDNCDPYFYNNNGTCELQACVPNSSTSCVEQNLTGTKTCSANGSNYGSCVTTNSSTCESGYYYDQGVCKKEVCTPNATSSCQVSNGTGVTTCNANGSAQNSCQTLACNQGFYQAGNLCLPQACSPLSTTSCVRDHLVGVKTCNLNGSEYGSCVTGLTCEAGYYYDQGTCKLQQCSPLSSSTCSASNGTGTKTCSANGSNYSTCQINQCDPGFSFQNGSCVARTCSPGSISSCVSGQGVGSKTCDNAGLGFGSCIISSCQSGYYLLGQSCVAQTCEPNSSRQCVINHVIGSQSCNAAGSSYGPCNLGLTCESGFYYDQGTCKSQVCSPGSSSTCSIQNGSGNRQCLDSGAGFGECKVASCESGFIKENNSCRQNLCPVASSLGINTAQNTAVSSKMIGADNDQVGTVSYLIVTPPSKGVISNFNAQTGSFTYTPNIDSGGQDTFTYKTNDTYCDSSLANVNISVQCNQGSQLQNNRCVIQYNCQPGSTQSCGVSNGTGTQTCSSDGAGFGSCVASSCNSGHHKENASCLPDTRSCSTGGGTGVETWNGSSYGSCLLTACPSGSSLSNNACVASVCSPYSTTSCTIGAGSGNQSCNATGTALSSCQLHSCQSGYYLENNQCKPFLCTPSSSETCKSADNLGTGNRFCSNDGLSWGSCQLYSCQSGNYLENNQCKPYLCAAGSSVSCPVPNGAGVKYCSSSGMSYSECQNVTCSSGYHLENSSCLTNTKSCTITNGTGTQTWNGGSYNACQVVSCSSGYKKQNNTCVDKCSAWLIEINLGGIQVCI